MGRISTGQRRYVVRGPHAVLGHEPGEQFIAVLDPEQEQRMLTRGSLEIVDDDLDDAAALTREELNELAAELGIPNPGRLPNKQAVIDAINQACEGHEDTQGGVA